MSVGEADRAISRVTEGLRLSRPPHNDWVASIAFVIQGLAHQLEGRNEEALASFAEARTHADGSRRPRLLGRVLSFAADIHLRLGRYAEAKGLLRQAVHLVEEAGDVFLCARGLTRLGTAEQGEEIRARPWPSITRPCSSTGCCPRSPNPRTTGWRWTYARGWAAPTWRRAASTRRSGSSRPCSRRGTRVGTADRAPAAEELEAREACGAR